ncbi:MAG TPA: hypothetical protein VN031_01090 [Candidatus Microsaccharimonas sp.]|nr:hypothetical protein [Candidatus Microsaccharimonas sp.]
MTKLRALPLETYHEYHEKRIQEETLAIDGLYGVMLRIDSDRSFALMLPALVTGKLPSGPGQRIAARMPDRLDNPVNTQVELYDGVFSEFEDSHILVPRRSFGPEVTEGFFLQHQVILARSTELQRQLGLHRAANT